MGPSVGRSVLMFDGKVCGGRADGNFTIEKRPTQHIYTFSFLFLAVMLLEYCEFLLLLSMLCPLSSDMQETLRQ